MNELFSYEPFKTNFIKSLIEKSLINNICDAFKNIFILFKVDYFIFFFGQNIAFKMHLSFFKRKFRNFK